MTSTNVENCSGLTLPRGRGMGLDLRVATVADGGGDTAVLVCEGAGLAGARGR